MHKYSVIQSLSNQEASVGHYGKFAQPVEPMGNLHGKLPSCVYFYLNYWISPVKM